VIAFHTVDWILNCHWQISARAGRKTGTKVAINPRQAGNTTNGRDLRTEGLNFSPTLLFP
jgi:hypothetical protein